MKIQSFIFFFVLFFNSFVINRLTAQEVVPKIRLGHEGEEGFHRQLLFAFDPLSTDGVDNGFDARQLEVFTTDGYWVINNEPFVIQARPFDMNILVDIGVVSAFDQVHTFMIDALEDYTGDVFLYDNLTGQLFDLKTQPASVNVPTGTFNDRFKMAFTSETLSLNPLNETLTALKAFYDKNSEQIFILNPTQIGINRLSLYSLSGALVFEDNLTESHLASNQLYLPYIKNGLYLLRIESAQTSDVFKIVKY